MSARLKIAENQAYICWLLALLGACRAAALCVRSSFVKVAGKRVYDET